MFDTGGVAQVLLRPLRLGLVMAYVPRGPLPAGPLPDAIRALRRALGRHRCVALLCDPEVPDSDDLLRAIGRAGGRRSPVFVQPRRTLLVNTKIDPDLLLGDMRRKTRQYIRKAERAGVITEETDDLARFHRVLRVVGERDRFAVHSLAYFERLRAGLGGPGAGAPGRVATHVLMARIGDEDVGALMLARMAERAWELYGGWSGAHAEERPFYLLKWRAMMRMRQLDVERYDMWGLSDPRSGGALARAPVLDLVASRLGLRAGGTVDPLEGVTQFKLGFGGDVVTWLGAVEAPVRRWLYPVWQLLGRRRLARGAA